jgi:hypothetical protein
MDFTVFLNGGNDGMAECVQEGHLGDQIASKASTNVFDVQ